MRARRGFLLAGIHVTVALPLLAWNASERLATGGIGALWQEPVVHAAMLQEADRSGTVAINMGPCTAEYVGVPLAVDERFISAANMPATVLAGWFDPCPARWTLSALVDPERRYSREIAAKLIGAYIGAIVLQWFLVGAFPLIQTSRWWHEPGAFVTACCPIGGLPLLVSDAAGGLGLLKTGAALHTVSQDLVAAFSGFAAVLMVLAWSGWGLLLVIRGLRRVQGAFRGLS